MSYLKKGLKKHTKRSSFCEKLQMRISGSLLMAAFFLTREISCYLYNHKLEFPSGWFIDIDDTCTSSNFVYVFSQKQNKNNELFFLFFFLYQSIIFRANKVVNFQSCFFLQSLRDFFLSKKKVGKTLVKHWKLPPQNVSHFLTKLMMLKKYGIAE